jgi:carboxylesterase type B
MRNGGRFVGRRRVRENLPAADPFLTFVGRAITRGLPVQHRRPALETRAMWSAGIRFGIAGLAAAWLTAAAISPANAETSNLIAASTAAPSCTTPPVSTPAGRICGLAETIKDQGGPVEVDAYEGIRYGTAKRWMAPVPVPQSSALVKATAFGPACPQAPVPGYTQSEDCLFLNLWTPTRSSVKRLPVLVFFHGGSFVDGAGSVPVYDGARLAARGRVILVTLNYRLGALGFLAGGSGTNRLAGNYGFQDQQLALRWVRRNISSFGGDPARITIFGESAGAMSVGAHLVAPGSQSLFHSAIMESNPYGLPFKTPSQADMVRTEFDQTPDAKVCNGNLACLEKLPPARIVAAQGEVSPSSEQLLQGRLGEILSWAPYIDRRLITGQPNAHAITQAVIAGTNRDEGTLFVVEAIPHGLSAVEYIAAITALFKGHAAAILTDPRYAPDNQGNLTPLANIVGDYIFSCATRHVLGNAKGAHFGYSFNHSPSYPVMPQGPKACLSVKDGGQGSVCHGDELPFVFRNPYTLTAAQHSYGFTSGEQILVDAISAYWTNLAAAGDPNSGTSAPKWPGYGSLGTRQVLDVKISQTTDSMLSCPLWDAIGYGQGAISLY